LARVCQDPSLSHSQSHVTVTAGYLDSLRFEKILFENIGIVITLSTGTFSNWWGTASSGWGPPKMLIPKKTPGDVADRFRGRELSALS